MDEFDTLAIDIVVSPDLERSTNEPVKIGTCGFRRSKSEYKELLSTVEIQHTFYQPPKIETLKRWRAAMPSGFEFTVKAWQLITHEAKSPTYKRLRTKFTETELSEAGSFKPTSIVKAALDKTLASAAALEAHTILFQCPASFLPTEDNIRNLSSFFSSIDRSSLNLVWEPRGAWDDETIKELCTKLELWHVVDPFSRATVTPDNCYFRLHGRGSWRYQYEGSELDELIGLLPKNRLSYVFFNNIMMTEDAVRFRHLMQKNDWQ